MSKKPSPEAIEYRQWIASLPADERRKAIALGVAKFEPASDYGRTVEDWQLARISAPAADPDDDDWNLRLDLLGAGAPAERLDEIVSTIEDYAETLGYRCARRALHARTMALVTSTDARHHAIAHAFDLTLMTMTESAEICGCSKQYIRKLVLAIQKRVSAGTL